MKKEVERYKFDLLTEILSQISPEHQAVTDGKMLKELKKAEAKRRRGFQKDHGETEK